jgi:hypothetical protein
MFARLRGHRYHKTRVESQGTIRIQLYELKPDIAPPQGWIPEI